MILKYIFFRPLVENESFINSSLESVPYKSNVLIYAAGFIQRVLIANTICDECQNHLREL